jgi:hypothetical protein
LKLSELRPCDVCSRSIVPLFYVIRISQAMVMPEGRAEANALFGTKQILGNTRAAGQIARVMVGESDEAVAVFGEKQPSLYTNAIVCQDCFCMGNVKLPVLVEAIARRDERAVMDSTGDSSEPAP